MTSESSAEQAPETGLGWPPADARSGPDEVGQRVGLGWPGGQGSG